MSEFEDKLNALLSSPESIEQIANLAKTLSASQSSPDTQKETSAPQPDIPSADVISKIAAMFSSPPPQGTPTSAAAPPAGGFDVSSLSSLLGGIDPQMIARLLPVIAKLNDGRQDERAALLYSLKPFLKSERQDKIDQALKLAKLFSAGKLFLKGLGEQ